jgi:putative SOS response-associated peptidase YedK
MRLGSNRAPMQLCCGHRAPASWYAGRLDGKRMAWAGLWEVYRWPGSDRITRNFCVITVPASRADAPIHDRVPLVLDPAHWPLWLVEAKGNSCDLVKSPADGTIKAVQIPPR